MSGEDFESLDRGDSDGQKPDKMFTLKKWNAVAMWSWDVECDTCAICRVQVMGNACRFPYSIRYQVQIEEFGCYSNGVNVKVSLGLIIVTILYNLL